MADSATGCQTFLTCDRAVYESVDCAHHDHASRIGCMTTTCHLSVQQTVPWTLDPLLVSNSPGLARSGTACVSVSLGAAGPTQGHDRLSLPFREYFKFDIELADLLEPGWLEKMPWSAQALVQRCPNLLWPEDHSWILVSDIDFDSTVLGGSRYLAEAISRDPYIEARLIPEGANLSASGDNFNCPGSATRLNQGS